MAIRTYAQQLEDVQVAIQAVEAKGQAYGVDGHQLTRADLATLYAREERLMKIVARQSRGGIPVYTGVPRG